ncbi:major facilitator superfamily transporter [Ilyonectria robusta]|uniref:major facilitator superfamily transporter n=1 Tax=Ilyonectria robusta TaxID=1079257 RepID=UPI001E8E57E8|nr:major facilitator superfamily transporter [Ilyonectria robusta]KAH8733813.1 major facilitator superfamily transporter [Ilyonectria robusta]
MSGKTSSPAPHGSSGGSEKHQEDIEKRREVTEQPLPSSTSDNEQDDDDDDVRDTSNQPAQDLERMSTLGTVLSRLRSRRSAVIEPPPDGGLRAWMVVFSTHLVMMDTWGIINSFGVFQPYYMDKLNRPPADISWIGSFEVFLLFFIGTFAGRLTDAGYFRPLYIVGVILVSLGTLMTSFCSTYWQFFLAQGICVGLGNGLLFCPCMAVTSTYFAKKRSLAFGLTAAGSTTGGLIFPSMVRQLLPQIGFAWTIRSIALIQFATLILAGFFMKSRIPPRSAGPLVEWAAFRDLEYTFYAIGAYLAFWSTYFAFHYLAAFSRDILGMSYSSSLDLLLVLNGIGGPGRVIPAYIGDKIGPVNVYMSCTLVAGLIMYCWAAVDSVAGLYVWASFYGIAVGGVQSVFPAGLTSLTADPQKQGTRMGMVFTIVSFATLTGSPIAGAIISSQGGKYVGAQVFSGTSMVLATVFIAAARAVKTRKTGLAIFSLAKV